MYFHVLLESSALSSLWHKISKKDASEYLKLVWVPWKRNIFWQCKPDGGHQIYFTQLSRKSAVYNNLIVLTLWTEMKHAVDIRDCKFFSLVILTFSVYLYRSWFIPSLTLYVIPFKRLKSRLIFFSFMHSSATQPSDKKLVFDTSTVFRGISIL